jgi:hypothetical protein
MNKVSMLENLGTDRIYVGYSPSRNRAADSVTQLTQGPGNGSDKGDIQKRKECAFSGISRHNTYSKWGLLTKRPGYASIAVH